MKDHYPYKLENEYIKLWSRFSANLSKEIASKISKALQTKIKIDADKNPILSSDEADIQDILSKEKSSEISPQTIASIKQFYHTLNGWSYARTEEMIKSLRTARKKSSRHMPTILIDPNSETVKHFQDRLIKTNIDLAKQLKNEYIDGISKLAADAFLKGSSTSDFAKQYIDLAEVDNSKARFWARDQVGSAYAEFNSQRFREAGIPGFVWMTAMDNRVRDSHAFLHGKFFSFTGSPPQGLNKPGARLPGEDYNCRCRQNPALDESDALPESKIRKAIQTINKARERFGQEPVHS